MGEWTEAHRSLVEPKDCDYNNHMNVSGYFERFSNATMYYLAMAGASHGEVVERGLGLASIATTLRYFSEVVHTDPVRVESAVLKLGRSSIHHAHRLLNARTGELSATALYSEVLIDLDARSSTAWPDDLRAQLEPLIVEIDDEQRALFEPIYPPR